MKYLLIILFAVAASFGQSRTVALTFDDLPLGGKGDAAEALQANQKILESLARHKAPAVAFVIEQRVRNLSTGMDILRSWVAAGHELANHSYSHPNFSDTGVAEFRKQIVDGEPAIREAGGKPRYFRFPMNHTGDTKQKHDAIAEFLKQRGYTMAPCTLENVDYEFARVYRLLSGEEANRLKKDYLAFTSAILDYYAEQQRKALGGREVPDIMLLHANALNGDTIDQILEIFKSKGYRFVTLDEAMKDPVYQKPDQLITKFGPMWGLRWAMEAGMQIDTKAEPEVPEWIRKYGR